MITVIFEHDQSIHQYKFGTTLQEIVEQENITLQYPVLGALVNHKVRSATYRLCRPCSIKFFDITSEYGHDMYKRSLFFLLFKAVSDLYPQAKLRILHSISGGKYCELSDMEEAINEEIVAAIKARMDQLIEEDIPFERIELPTEEALRLYAEHGLTEKTRQFQYRKRIYTSIYKLGDKINYYYGFLVPSTRYIKVYDLEMYESGLLLKTPSRFRPDMTGPTRHLPKLFSVYKEYKSWAMALGVPYVMDINEKAVNNEIADIIRLTEAFQEKRFMQIAEEIHQKETVKMVLISGPSSSGKTTSCKRLSVHLALLGYQPIQISVDDFFVEREDTPKDIHGEYDFEALEAIDLKLFNQTLQDLTAGKEVQLPTFDFAAGKKLWNEDKKVKMQENSILLIEGIHCLNPNLTDSIEEEVKYKIFVSALTSISIDSHNPIPTADNRLIRRIVRDYNYRNYSALETLRRWRSVTNGEAKNIFPYQENANAMVNTALIYELGIFKPYAMPILNEVPETEPEYAEARRLLKFLSYFKSIPDQKIPGTSILREFIGGSQFHY